MSKLFQRIPHERGPTQSATVSWNQVEEVQLYYQLERKAKLIIANRNAKTIEEKAGKNEMKNEKKSGCGTNATPIVAKPKSNIVINFKSKIIY